MLQSIEIKREKFENGLVLVANEDRSGETIAIAGTIRAGAAFDSEGAFGAAELVSRLLTRGTEKTSASGISVRIEEMGATLNFTNYDESVSFSGRCHSRVATELIEILGECLTSPLFPQDQIEQARSEAVSEIKSENDETRTVAYRGLMSLVYGKDTPYGRNTLGKPEDIEKITRAEIESFYKEHYGPAGVVIAATGNFEFEVLRDELYRVFGHWGGPKRGTRLGEMGPSSRVSEGRIDLTSMKHKSQVDLAFGSVAVSRSSDQYYALNLGNLILGRMGLYGRLGKNVRDEKGLAYYCYSALQAKLHSGHLGIYAGVNPKNVEGAIQGISEEISRIANEEVSNSELEKAKRNSIGSLSIALDTSSERVNIIHDIEYYNLGTDFIERYSSLVNSVTSDQVLKAFGNYLNPKRVSLFVAGPTDASSLKPPGEIPAK